MFRPSSSHDELLCRLLTAVSFTSSLRDTASHVVPLFCRVLVMREYSSHRVIHYTFLLTCRIYEELLRVSIGFWVRPHPSSKRVFASYAPPVSGFPVRQASILYTAFFRFHLAMDTLAFTNGSPYQCPLRTFTF